MSHPSLLDHQVLRGQDQDLFMDLYSGITHGDVQESICNPWVSYMQDNWLSQCIFTPFSLRYFLWFLLSFLIFFDKWGTLAGCKAYSWLSGITLGRLETIWNYGDRIQVSNLQVKGSAHCIVTLDNFSYDFGTDLLSAIYTACVQG